MKSALGLGLLATMTTASLAPAQNNGASGNGEKPTTTTEASSFQEGMVTMAPGEGITFDLGDEFMLNLFNLFQFGYLYSGGLFDSGSPLFEEHESSFELFRARTYLNGHVFDPSVDYLMSMEWTDLGDSSFVSSSGSTQVIKDAWVAWTFWEDEDNDMALRAGQSQTGFGRQGSIFDGGYELPGPGQMLATRTFAAMRSRGAWVDGSHVENKLSWSAGFQNSDVASAATGVQEFGEDVSNADNELNFLALVRYDTSDDMEMFWGREADLLHRENVDWGGGGSLFVGNEKNTGGSDVETTAFNLNAWLKTQGFYVGAEWFSREDDVDGVPGDEGSSGWQVQASYTTEEASTQYGIVAGASGINLDGNAGAVSIMTGTPLDTTPGDILELLVGLDMYYHAHNMKTQLAYIWQEVDPDGANDDNRNILLLSFQLIF